MLFNNNKFAGIVEGMPMLKMSDLGMPFCRDEDFSVQEANYVCKKEGFACGMVNYNRTPSDAKGTVKSKENTLRRPQKHLILRINCFRVGYYLN